ncbi:hypothetical protein [Streptomyces sp. NPDC051572]|uniref:hypothetical protein n=1 Tax=unclassified Streptomyces TaxID=2593676 RepID=UPI00344DD9D5
MYPAAEYALMSRATASGISSAARSMGANRSTSSAEGITYETFFAASALSFDAYRSVEVDLTDAALSDARKIADDARRGVRRRHAYGPRASPDGTALRSVRNRAFVDCVIRA